ncbi:hypothetical protein F4141_02590 [Candidatus Poribacteria bacterium]|nr:hypothetical protein [Candidatus Poribacteria bacterium]MYH79580.1 hypothetical protein [Candidatus Poribacteria bacterium]
MKLLTLLITLMLCLSVLLIGCDQEVTQPIMEVVKPPQDSLEMDSLELAQAAMERVNERRTEAHQKAEETGDFSTVFAASEDILKEELGFRKGLWVDLVEIYRQENLENPELLEGLENLEDAFVEKLKSETFGMFYFEYIRTFDALIVEYLRLSFEFPEKNEAELFILFRGSVRDGEIAIIFP